MKKDDKKLNKVLLLIVLSASLGFLAVEWVSLMIPHRIMLTAKLLLFAVSLTLGILSPKFGKPKKSKHTYKIKTKKSAKIDKNVKYYCQKYHFRSIF